MKGVFVGTTEKTQTFNLNRYTVKASLVVPGSFARAATAEKKPEVAGAIVFAIAPMRLWAFEKIMS